MLWAHLLAYVTGTVDQELLLRNEYGGGEPDAERSDQGSAVTLRRRESHLGGDRSPAGTKGLGGSGMHSATRYDSGLVSEAHRKEV
jgi:hypothetical protein